MLEPFLATVFLNFMFAKFDRIIKQFSTWLNATKRNATPKKDYRKFDNTAGSAKAGGFGHVNAPQTV